MKINDLRKILLIIGFLLLFYVISSIDYANISINSFNLDIKIIFFIFLLIGISFIIKTVRWKLLLSGVGIKINLPSLYFLTVSSMGLSVFTPAQSGDVMKLEFLKSKYGILRRKSFPTIILEKGQDLLLVCALFAFFMLYKGKELLDINYTVMVISILLMAVISTAILHIAQKRFIPIKKILVSLKTLLKNPKLLFLSFFLTILYWLINATEWLLLAKIVNIDVSFVTMLFVMSATVIFGLITLIPGAIGAMEASSALIIALLTDYPISRTVLFGLIVRLHEIIIFIIGYLHLMKRV